MAFVLSKIKYLNTECSGKDSKIKITTIGFADPRPLSKAAKYIGMPIDDARFDFKVNPGDVMNNELLSELRAFFTAKEIENLLSNYKEYYENYDRIIWEVVGKGIDQSDEIDNKYKRRVYINVSLER